VLGDHGLSRRSSSDPFDRYTQELLNVFDVLATVLGKVLVLLDILDRLFPAGQLDVLDLTLGEGVEIGGEQGFERLAVEEVLGTDLDRVEIVEDVEFRQVERSVTVDQRRVLHDDKIQPSASTSSTSRDAEFGSDFLKMLSDRVELLSGERSSSDSGGVSLDYSDGFSDRTGR